MIVPQAVSSALIEPERLPPSALGMPTTWRPQLAVQAAAPPDGADWIHEIKYDGYRTIAFIRHGQARFQTRGGHDWTARYGALVDAFADLRCETAILDGEVAVADERGVTTLHDLQRALVEGRTNALSFFAFDLVHLDGVDLRRTPLTGRRAALTRLLQRRPRPSARLQLSQHHRDGAALLAEANRFGAEGIMSKRAASPYLQTRSADWVKVKRTETGQFVVIGFLSNRPGVVSSLILAEEREGRLAYSCRAGAGLTQDEARALYRRLAQHERDCSPIITPHTAKARWVAPEWRVNVGFQGRTGQGKPRAPVLLSFT